MLNNIYYLKIKNYDLNIVKETELFKMNEKYLLNIEKEKFNIIEKIVYELALFHIEKLELKKDDIFIEFYIENLLMSKMDIEFYKDINNKILYKPFLTSITYLNNSSIPDIFTDVDIDTYKFKSFNEKNVLGFSFPKFLKHISFEGGKYFHGINNLSNENDERITLKVNIWNKTLNKEIFNNNEINDQNIIFHKNDKIIDFIEKTDNNYIISDVESLINEELFENILYKNNINFEGEILKNLLKLSNDYDFLTLKNNEETNDFNKNMNNKPQILINTSSKKFLQRFTFKNFYEKFICNFIANDVTSFLNNNNNNSVNYNNHEIVDIEKTPRIMNIILTSFQLIIENIKLSYCLKKNESYHIDKIFILKNNISTINNFFNDKNTITINILLNSKYEGGNLMFDDELENKLEMGDMIIYSGDTNHKYLPITNGTQYILVGLINIYE